MAVLNVYGMTQSGKSWHVANRLISNVERVLVFDPPRSEDFNNFDHITLNNSRDVLKVFRKYSTRKKYKIVLRLPNRDADARLLCDRLISLACALGRVHGPYNEKKRVWLVIDEADDVCNSNYQSKRVQHVVNKGRHDNVDSIFIARIPQRVHTDIRFNASKIVSFQLANLPKDFRDNFGADAKRIRSLGFRHRFEWDNTGQMHIFNEKNKIIWSFKNG